MTAETPANISKGELIGISCRIVAAYVGNNSLGASDIPDVIENVHRSLEGLSTAPSTTDTKQKPAVSIKRSVTPDHIICLEDGKKLKMLKRYIRTKYGLTPEDGVGESPTLQRDWTLGRWRNGVTDKKGRSSRLLGGS